MKKKFEISDYTIFVLIVLIAVLSLMPLTSGIYFEAGTKYDQYENTGEITAITLNHNGDIKTGRNGFVALIDDIDEADTITVVSTTDSYTVYFKAQRGNSRSLVSEMKAPFEHQFVCFQ